jgi:hypothetical protein
MANQGAYLVCNPRRVFFYKHHHFKVADRALLALGGEVTELCLVSLVVVHLRCAFIVGNGCPRAEEVGIDRR